MSDATETRSGWKQKVVSELVEYWIVVVYLACFLGVFTWYRRFVLAEYHISYAHYGVSVLEALVLAKLILIGNALRLGRRLDDRPLIIPTLFKTVMFSLLVGVFSVVERTIEGLLRGHGFAGGFEDLVSTGVYELLAKSLVTFFAFIPFFAFKELERVLGVGRLLTLSVRGRAATASGPSRRVRSECEGAAFSSQGAHREAQELDGGHEVGRAAELHP